MKQIPVIEITALTSFTVMPDYQAIKCGNQIEWVHPEIEEPLTNPAYLHGELEKLAGFDIAYHIPSEKERKVNLVIPEMRGDMSLNVWLCPVNKDQQWIEALLIWWIVVPDGTYTRYSFKGLIVDTNDQAAFNYAKAKQAELAPSI